MPKMRLFLRGKKGYSLFAALAACIFELYLKFSHFLVCKRRFSMVIYRANPARVHLSLTFSL